MGKNKKNVCERLIKNYAKICHQSNYYLRTLSHVACQILTLMLMSTNKMKRPFKKESPNDTHAQFLNQQPVGLRITTVIFAFDNVFLNKKCGKIKKTLKNVKNVYLHLWLATHTWNLQLTLLASACRPFMYLLALLVV